jgi:hypothetical protein
MIEDSRSVKIKNTNMNLRMIFMGSSLACSAELAYLIESINIIALPLIG